MMESLDYSIITQSQVEFDELDKPLSDEDIEDSVEAIESKPPKKVKYGHARERGKCTYPLMRRFQASLITGNFIETACDLVGINRKTYWDWMKKGELYDEAQQVGYSNDDDRIYSEFRRMVKEAQAWAEERATIVIAKSMLKEPKLALEWLKIRYPERYGRNRVELLGAEDAKENQAKLDGNEEELEKIKVERLQEIMIRNAVKKEAE